MPLSRELANKRSDHKDRHSRGPKGSGVEAKKGVKAHCFECDDNNLYLIVYFTGGAGAHNWGAVTDEEDALKAVDCNDPNYDSSQDSK